MWESEKIEDSYRKRAIIDGQEEVLEVLDTSGEEEFSTMQDLWIRKENGFLLVYSITSKQSFDRVEQIFEKICAVKEEEMHQVVIVLAGNKCDLPERREVSTQDAKVAAERWAKSGAFVSFYETSAKAKSTMKSAFLNLFAS
ncbi:hypothetical protein RFI_19586 [Reticulomyxa filosa]|uniref:Uncharacterized protein n=1 Tax=Reticulomyxa filosa TaxID=46433 RepID=X6MVR1_RETFI|nr:hypothetical protein RFI_19586 [Reticulomyxa filosa]|eukprot:ETO17731.1 hypothetical protein RFI_19586 [Reticulomyxa filosa]